MQQMSPAKKTAGPGQKFAVTLFCLLFAVGFGAGGVFGAISLFDLTYGWYKTRSWQPIMAEVTKAELRSSRGSKSTTYRVTAQYRYNVGGIEYTGTRVGDGDGSADNIGDWHKERFAELDDARKKGQRVLAWFNPDNPAEAVIDREARWGLMLFMVPFAFLFSAVSLGSLWMLFSTWRSK